MHGNRSFGLSRDLEPMTSKFELSSLQFKETILDIPKGNNLDGNDLIFFFLFWNRLIYSEEMEMVNFRLHILHLAKGI